MSVEVDNHFMKWSSDCSVSHIRCDRCEPHRGQDYMSHVRNDYSMNPRSSHYSVSHIERDQSMSHDREMMTLHAVKLIVESEHLVIVDL